MHASFAQWFAERDLHDAGAIAQMQKTMPPRLRAMRTRQPHQVPASEARSGSQMRADRVANGEESHAFRTVDYAEELVG
jgi:hypothetical protein